MASRIILCGLAVTVGAAAVTLITTHIFAIPSDGYRFRLIIGGLVAVGELSCLVSRHLRSKRPISFTAADACLSAVSIIAVTLGLCRWAEDTIARSSAITDFAQDYVAAYALRQGSDIFGASLRELGALLVPFGRLDNYHPPFTAVLFFPFTYLDYPVAFLLWSTLSLVIYVGLVLWLLHAYELLNWRWLHLSTVLLLWEPFTGNIFLGQLSVMLSAAVIAGQLLLRSGHERTAGCLFAIATLIKIYPGLIILYLLSQRRWRCSAAFCVALGVGLILIIVLLGSETLFTYVGTVVPEQSRAFGNYPLNISLGSVIKTFFEPTIFSAPPLPVSAIGQVATLAFSSLLVFAVTRLSYLHTESTLRDDIFSLFCVTMLITSPITWYHSCVLLLFPLVLLVRSFSLQGEVRSLTFSLLILILCGISNQDLFDSLLTANSSRTFPWYVMVICRTGFFGLLLCFWAFWSRLANSTGVSFVRGLANAKPPRSPNQTLQQ